MMEDEVTRYSAELSLFDRSLGGLWLRMTNYRNRMTNELSPHD